jgi:hypothetical protein
MSALLFMQYHRIKGSHQFHGSAFCSFHIPVWYRWREQEMHSVEQNPGLTRFPPLLEQLQTGTTMLFQEPPAQICVEYQRMEQDAEKKCKHPSWQEFFVAHDSLNTQNLASETAANTQKCLEQEQDPPTVSAKVYEWVTSIEDLSVLVHELVAKNSRFEVLSLYPLAQK